MVKNLPAMQKLQEMQVRYLAGEDSLEEEEESPVEDYPVIPLMETHSSILVWRIPWT